MRLLFGIILGVALTIGGAYITDTAFKPANSTVDQRPMVNWEVVGRNFDSLTTMIKQGWTKLTG